MDFLKLLTARSAARCCFPDVSMGIFRYSFWTHFWFHPYQSVLSSSSALSLKQSGIKTIYSRENGEADVQFLTSFIFCPIWFTCTFIHTHKNMHTMYIQHVFFNPLSEYQVLVPTRKGPCKFLGCIFRNGSLIAFAVIFFDFSVWGWKRDREKERGEGEREKESKWRWCTDCLGCFCFDF